MLLFLLYLSNCLHNARQAYYLPICSDHYPGARAPPQGGDPPPEQTFPSSILPPYFSLVFFYNVCRGHVTRSDRGTLETVLNLKANPFSGVGTGHRVCGDKVRNPKAHTQCVNLCKHCGAILLQGSVVFRKALPGKPPLPPPAVSSANGFQTHSNKMRAAWNEAGTPFAGPFLPPPRASCCQPIVHSPPPPLPPPSFFLSFFSAYHPCCDRSGVSKPRAQ